jgi:exodeoxyribonuclease-3
MKSTHQWRADAFRPPANRIVTPCRALSLMATAASFPTRFLPGFLPMPFSIATWNINSVRLRLPIVERLLAEQSPDVLCLQETKCPDELFPVEAFHKLGYQHVAFAGQKGYHGVATISRRPLEAFERRRFCKMEDSRHISTRIEAGGKSILLHNFYVPAGGDEPDPERNWKFRHKLDFVQEMNEVRAEWSDSSASVLVGDLNIAPLENDVWSHKQLLKVVSHTPVETENFEAMRKAGNWVDLMRHVVPADQKIYTWWSYRAADWKLSDRGRRLDHIWSSENIVGDLKGIEVLRAARGWERPSDHVPVIARFGWE